MNGTSVFSERSEPRRQRAQSQVSFLFVYTRKKHTYPKIEAFLNMVMRTKMFILTPLNNIRHEPALTLFERLYLNNRWTDFDQISLIQLENWMRLVNEPIPLTIILCSNESPVPIANLRTYLHFLFLTNNFSKKKLNFYSCHNM